jgi:beta-lactamase regulating signal transducer with metallopeptidase domain
MSDALLLLLRVNLATAAAVAVVMALRLPVRRLFGAGAAYALWILPPLAVLAMFAPGRVVTLAQPAAEASSRMIWGEVMGAAPQPLAATVNWPPILAGLWIAGGLASLALLAWQQSRFARAVRVGRGGPAVIGILRPRIVTPDDFARRYTPREQMVVLAHEQTHIARHDSRINAAVALARCALWFNPLVHVLAHTLRIDQELACDAAVVAAHPTARRTYAEALLKTQLAGRPLPLGCYWPAAGAHPLAQRIGLLAAAAPRWPGRRLGAAAVATLALTAAWTAWAARPAQVIFATAPQAQMQLVAAAPQPSPEPAAVTLAAAQPLAETPWPPLHPMKTRLIDAMPFALDSAPAAEEPPKLMKPGQFGPDHRFRTAASWSKVEPGSAIRVIATMTDPQGVPLTTDLTAFGSQSWYRLGYISRSRSRYKLFTSVAQRGERLVVTAGLDRSFSALDTGSIELRSGETGTIRLPNGLSVTVTPILRAETDQERAATRPRPFINVEQVEGL